MEKKELEDYLWGAANILRGMIDAADFKQYIFPLLFFKRISDLWDEEYQLALEESEGDLDYASFAENGDGKIADGPGVKCTNRTLELSGWLLPIETSLLLA